MGRSPVGAPELTLPADDSLLLLMETLDKGSADDGGVCPSAFCWLLLHGNHEEDRVAGTAVAAGTASPAAVFLVVDGLAVLEPYSWMMVSTVDWGRTR